MGRGKIAELVEAGPFAVESADHADLVLGRHGIESGGKTGHADIDRAGDDRLGNGRASAEIDELGLQSFVREVAMGESDIDRPRRAYLQDADLDLSWLRAEGRGRNDERAGKREREEKSAVHD